MILLVGTDTDVDQHQVLSIRVVTGTLRHYNLISLILP